MDNSYAKTVSQHWRIKNSALVLVNQFCLVAQPDWTWKTKGQFVAACQLPALYCSNPAIKITRIIGYTVVEAQEAV